MPYENKWKGDESIANGTPSTASRIKARPLENAFPTPPRRDTNQTSNFANDGTLPPSPPRVFPMPRAASTPPEQTSDALRNVNRSRGNSTGVPSSVGLQKSWRRRDISKKTSQYFDEAFALREPNVTAKERVLRDSPLIGEVKLNCCLEAHRDFLIDLSFQLSEIYQKPLSCVVVAVSPSVHIMMGGSSEPAYTVTITALPSDIATTKNKRVSHLLQCFVNETLHIPPSRGIVNFNPVPEENLATNGVTALQEIETVESEFHEEKSIVRAVSRQTHRLSKKSQTALTQEREKVSTPLSDCAEASAPGLRKKCEDDDLGLLGASMSVKRRVKNRKSIMAFFRPRKGETGC